MLAQGERGIVATAAALVFTRVFGFSLVLPGFREHAGRFTSDPVLIGVAFSAYALTLALLQLPLGMLSDRIGRRPVLLLGSASFVAGSLWAAAASDITSLIAARLLQGTGAIGAVAMAAVGESVGDARRTTAMAFVGIPAGVGFLVGLLMAPLLPLSVPGLFILTAAVGTLAGIPVLLMRLAPPLLRPTTPTTRPLAGLAAAGFATSFALTAVLFFLPVSDLRLVAMLAVAFGLMLLATRRADRQAARIAPVAWLVLALAPLGAFFAVAAAPWLLVGGALFFAAHATLSAMIPSQVSRLSGPAGGRGHGVQAVVAYLGAFVAGPVAGYFIELRWAPFVILAAASLVAALLLKPPTFLSRAS